MNINTVGLSDLQTPVQVRQRGGGLQHTIATISMRAELREGAGTDYVDRARIFIGQSLDNLSIQSFREILPRLQKELCASSVRLSMEFPWFINKQAPVTGTHGLMDYKVSFSGGIGEDPGFILGVTVPVTTLCPCSKEISDAGAHNQRAEVKLNVRFRKCLWAEELIELVETCGSSELYSLLKRPDEKYVTEQAYNNPMFVEDVVRKVAEKALHHEEITWFTASAESFESIHNHSAYAYVESEDLGKAR
ncbi:GTP cyclohydrolase I FolE2 [Desulforhopalus vacuolatus]|nr:GTP cyclohydrolase I FolE2 [Desulforhopalus vacuolatus]